MLMQRNRRRVFAAVISFVFVAARFSSCVGEVINAESSSSYLEKVRAGLAQSAEWLSAIVVGTGTENERPPRTVTLALVGLGRTGSTSFAAALKQLGYVPIHDDEVLEVSDLYAAMIDGSMTMDEVNAALGGRGFDAPMVSTPEYVTWAAAAPGVKVILTVRDKSKWARSWLSIVPVAFLPHQRPFRWFKQIRELAALNTKMKVDVPTNGHPELYDDIPTLEAGFEAWNAFVRDTVPPEKLLEFDVRQGWGPLCNFLDKPVPEGKFPHINDRVVINVIVKVLVAVTWVWPLVVALPALIVIFLVRRYLLGARTGKVKEKHA